MGKLKEIDRGKSMIKVFISHKQEDWITAKSIAFELERMGVPFYLDVLDSITVKSGKELTEHIKKNLNDCTDIIVVMSETTKNSQWVPFEVGMAAQNDMPTATFLQASVLLPDFLAYWPRLKYPSDIQKYIVARKEVKREYSSGYLFETAMRYKSQTERFYEVLKHRL